MQVFKKLFDFYVFSNIHVAFGVFCLTKITLFSFQIDDNSTAWFVFFSTIISYNFIRFLNLSEDKNWITIWFVKHKKILITMSVLSSFVCIYFAIDFKLKTIIILIPLILLIFFYGVPLPNRLFSLRKIPELKIFVIAFCFAGVTVIFPIVQNNIEVSSIVWVLFLQRLFFVMLITIPFDIRDVDFDSNKLKTIPQRFGVVSAKRIGVFLGVVIVILEYAFLFENVRISLVVFTISVVSVSVLLFSTKNQSKYYSSFWVESIPILWLLLLEVSLVFYK